MTELYIAKTFDFDAAHFLPHVPEDHKCRRMHGHTYRVRLGVGVVVADLGELDVRQVACVLATRETGTIPYSREPLRRALGASHGMLIDYADLARAWEPMHALLDHRVLNEIEGLSNPTTEQLAVFLSERLVIPYPCAGSGAVQDRFVTLRVYESATTYADLRWPL